MIILRESRLFLIIYTIILILELIGIGKYPHIRLVSKAMIMVSLIVYYLMYTKKQENVFLFGMIAALLGDIFLLFHGNMYFIVGLLCFLIMQICYSVTFYKRRKMYRSKDTIVFVFILLIPLLFLSVLWIHLADLKKEVVAYSIAIATMLFLAYYRHHRQVGYKFVLIGAILFVISDMMLAYGKFISSIPTMDYFIIIIYMVAQFLIVSGVSHQYKLKISNANSKLKFGRHKMNLQ